jgi:hypothetical protein
MDAKKTEYNSTYKKLAVQCSADTFLVNQSLVLRINPASYRDGKNRHYSNLKGTILISTRKLIYYKPYLQV